jgi:dolichol-phosphate mannosyltransferase
VSVDRPQLAATSPYDNARIAVVIPCYRVSGQIKAVIDGIGPEVERIYCIDDCCPDRSGDHIRRVVTDKRVRVIDHEANQGVGGAMITGYLAALADGANIVVKLDGDGQMDASLIQSFVQPIIHGYADYTKGNRFFRLEDVQAMPPVRLFGNAALAFLSKFSTGYWNLFDPTNGFVAIHRQALTNIPLHKISRGYFFESDMLFRLNTIGAVVIDIPMTARYGNETSSLKIGKLVFPFLGKHVTNFVKRIFYNYFLRDFNLASVELLAGTVLVVFGALFGVSRWMESAATGIPATAGTVMLAAFPVLMGFQLLLGFLNFDIQNTPTFPLQKKLAPPHS